MAQQQPHFNRIPRLRLWITLGWFMLLAGCATPFGIAQQDFQLLPPGTLKQPATVLLKLNNNQGETSHNWEAVLSVNAERTYLIILGPLGQRLATLSLDGEQLTIKHDSPIPIDISLEKLLGELQMIFWPLAVLNASKQNQDWYFEEQKHIRLVYYQQQQVAEIHRRSSLPWGGDFSYISRISDYHLSIRSSQLDRP